MYAIMIDIDNDYLRSHYGEQYSKAYNEIRNILEKYHFHLQYGNIYFGCQDVNTASVTLAVIDLTTRLPWFAPSVRDIRMLRVEEISNLLPVVQRILARISH